MKQLQKIGIVGGGLIGMSWASLFLARGMTVVVVEPRPEAEAQLQQFIADAWPKLQALGLTISDTARQAEVTDDFDRLRGVDFVQECGPDRIEVKRVLIRQMEQVLEPQVVIASSTSSLLASELQSEARHPDRILVGHPMNPPHLVPMVELVAGRLTSVGSMQTAEGFYRLMQRVTIRVQQEVVGHLANRLTSALYREAVHLAAEGIASVADIDKAITYGPGMRWALLGPHLTYHLGGGAGGYQGYLEHLGPTQEARWQELGRPKLTEEVKARLVAGLEKELADQDQTTLAQRRDDALVEIYKLKQKYGF